MDLKPRSPKFVLEAELLYEVQRGIFFTSILLLLFPLTISLNLLENPRDLKCVKFLLTFCSQGYNGLVKLNMEAEK